MDDETYKYSRHGNQARRDVAEAPEISFCCSLISSRTSLRLGSRVALKNEYEELKSEGEEYVTFKDIR